MRNFVSNKDCPLFLKICVLEIEWRKALCDYLFFRILLFRTYVYMDMKDYGFDEEVNRRGTNSMKWDEAEADVLPMWVADMDFRTAPCVRGAVERRAAHGVFGYTHVPDAYYEAVAGWFARRHGWHVAREWILYTSGVVPALSAVIKALARPGDRVLVQSPVYNCFFSSIRNNGCEAVQMPLLCKEGRWVMDYDALEHEAADPRASLLLLCNPHNPVGRVWTREELVRLGGICQRHGVAVVSDEIHGELAFPDHPYTPFGTLEAFRRMAVICTSPSKAFNMAGLQIANIMVEDADWRWRIDRAINDNEVCDVNPFGVEALMAAYNEGASWLDALLAYLQGNYRAMWAFCRERLPEFPVADLEGTYLAWMDCRALGMPSDELEKALRKGVRLWLNAGTMYGEGGEGYMRWNLACPRSRMLEGLKRFEEYVRR